MGMVEAPNSESKLGDSDLCEMSMVMPQDQDEEASRELLPEEREQIERMTRNFYDSSDKIRRSLENVSRQIGEARSVAMVRQLVEQCFSDVVDCSLSEMSYSEAMRILSDATTGLNNRRAQPQDVQVDIDFYGQVERLTEQFVTDIRRVEM